MKKKLLPYFIILISPVLFSQCAAVKSQKMAAQNKETVRLWFEEGWNHNRNAELLEVCFDEDWQDGNPLRPDQVEGYEGMLNLIKSYRDAFPDAHFIITHLFADEHSVAVRYEVTARHLGPMFGIEPTGREFTSTGIVLYEMENGRIKVSWQELDLMGIINQLKE